MGYIGRTPAYGNFEKDNHTGDGVTSQFNLTYPVASPTQLLVSLDGVIQEPDYSYNVTMVSGQGKINFSEAPDIGARIFIVYVGRQLLTAGSNAPSTYLDEFNGDNSTVSFTLTRTPATTDAANFIVYVDNIYQREGSSYAFTISGETITFTSAPPTGTNNIQVYQLSLSNEVNTVSDGAVTEAKLANGAVTETKLGTDVQGRLDQVDSAMGFKNRIIGGNFSTNPWQRGTSFSGLLYNTGPCTADRFRLFNGTSTGVIYSQKTADAPTVAEAGVFTQHCFDVVVTTADSSIASSDNVSMWQSIEGYNIMDLGFGQPGTRYVTLSFWHKHTKTGINCISIRNDDASRSYVAEYTQSVSNTWEKAEITIPVDTSGTWLYDNGSGCHVSFVLVNGSDEQTTAGSWQAGNYNATSNQVNNLDSTSNNFKIALVQLEAGDKATRFETRSVGQELALCQRYYHEIKKFVDNANRGDDTYWDGHLRAGTYQFPVVMRVSPTVTIVQTYGWKAGDSGWTAPYPGKHPVGVGETNEYGVAWTGLNYWDDSGTGGSAQLTIAIRVEQATVDAEL